MATYKVRVNAQVSFETYFDIDAANKDAAEQAAIAQFESDLEADCSSSVDEFVTEVDNSEAEVV